MNTISTQTKFRTLGQRLRSGSLISFLFTAGGLLLGFATQVLLARSMTQAHYGEYGYWVSWVAIFSTAAGLGFPAASSRFVAQYVARGRQLHLNQFVLLALSTPLVVSLIVFAGFVLYDRLWAQPHMAFGLSVPIIVGLLVIGAVLSGSAQAILQGFQRIVRLGLIRLGARLVVFFGAIAAFVGFLQPASVDQMLIILVLAFYGAAALALIWIFEDLPRLSRWRDGMLRHGFYWHKVAIPMLGLSFGILAYQKIDILMLGSIGGMEMVAVYTVAVTLNSLSGLFSNAVLTILVPMISELFRSGQKAQLQTALELASRYFLVGNLVLSAGLILGHALIFSLFGAPYQEALWPMLILMMGSFVNSATGPVGYAMLMLGKERTTLILLLICLVLNVLLNAVLIPLYGYNGAAVATAATASLYNILQQWYLRKELGLTVGSIHFSPESISRGWDSLLNFHRELKRS